ncbi:hypothetical protein SDRG_05840 [Saprolegnia diclina VS20]|uniref:Uncharacterized protein n=1 Tax=Saprolegnia diclina (strain VS20) TaxID=1156394 RepID=T0QQL8_SAPDV|nr:hypothetical protein SDRG_05840 [Saprolegnia diclina VS20]EQC37021.1 hypothetical protein SDRG_05840 [Saprolegnia diclina VS20]|eukprot:XP_008609802.1 hypothetical protein SDRG_05840 [Saprolegnia diclina VS20]
MSSEKRRVGSPTRVVDKDDVLMAIVKFTTTAEDVSTFLDAISATTRCGPLKALSELLRDPLKALRDARDEATALTMLWPRLQLDYVVDVKRVIDAMPIYNSFEVGSLHLWKDMSPSMDVLAQLVASYGEKFTHIKIDSKYPCENEKNVVTLCNILRQSTRLDVVSVGNTGYDMAIVAAVTTPKHSVRRLSVASDRAEDNWAENLVPWLQSGHADHLGIQYDVEKSGENRSIADVLVAAAASSLSSLNVLVHGAEPLPPVDTHTTRFQNLSTLCVRVDQDAPFFKSLLDRVDPTKLRRLSVTCSDESDNIGFVLDTLPHLSALNELQICSGAFDVDELPPAVMTSSSALTSITMEDIQFSSNAAAALGALFANVLDLKTLSWRDCFVDDTTFGDVILSNLPLWIRNGVRAIDLAGCDAMDGFPDHLVRALRGATSPSGIDINLSDNGFTHEKYVMLFKALTTCTGVSVVLEPSVELGGEAVAREAHLAREDFEVMLHGLPELELEWNEYVTPELPEGEVCVTLRVSCRR